MKRQREAENKRRERVQTFIALIGLLLFLLLVGRVGYWETHYNRDATVVSVQGQLVTVEDRIGMLWDFYADGYKVGDEVRMLMDNNTTDNIITDDTIEDVKLR